ncbi:MAG: phosphoribosylamine--glycine ligase [bacterium]
MNSIQRLLIIGSGGREHAIGLCLKKQSPDLSLFFAPGNAGTSLIGKNIPIKDTQLPELLHFVKETHIDLTFVGPEAPLVLGIVDLFESEGLCIIGPSREAAQLEGSKEWAKKFMQRHGIPSADYASFTSFDKALSYLKTQSLPIVIKADGLAAGKGVSVCSTFSEAEQALSDCLLENKFNSSGQRVLIESFMEGQEASIFAFTDGHSFTPMLACQDHKQIHDGDKGPNTGGMGAYCPAPIVTPEIFSFVSTHIFQPLVSGFAKEGIAYTGIIYAGLMIHGDQVRVVEFNVRFGDPETQVILPLLKTHLADIFNAISTRRLSELTIEWSENSAVCVVLASKGYPTSSSNNEVIHGLDTVSDFKTAHIVHAGTVLDDDDTILSHGGRVLAVVNVDKTLAPSIKGCYKALSNVHFKGCQFRRDIGQKAL